MSVSGDDLVYHYTSAQGLMGIVRDRAIWATDFRYLNDERELRRGLAGVTSFISGADDYFRESAAGAGVEAAIANDHVYVVEQLLGAVFSLAASPSGPYIACFSTEGDRLSQWRGYGSGQYAMGFAKEGLAGLAPIASGGVDEDGNWQASEDGFASTVRLSEVVYVDESQTDGEWAYELEVAAREVVNRFPRIPGDIGATVRRGVDDLLNRLASLKADSFKDECEWRVVVTVHQAIETMFREDIHGVLVPYVRVPLQELKGLLREVVLGPGLGDEAVFSTKAFLRDRGLINVDVRRSNIPFRNI